MIKCLKGKFIDKSLLSITDENGKKLKLFALAVPLFLEGIASIFIGLIQSILSSRYMGGFFVIPINVANSVVGIFNAILMVPFFGLSILLSINIGKKNHEDCKKLIGASISIMLIMSFAFFIICLIFGQHFLQFMGMGDADYAVYMPYALEYLKYRMLILFLLYWYTVFNMAMRCYGYSAPGFMVSLIINGMTTVITAMIFFVIKSPKEHVIKAISLAIFIATLSGTIFSVIAFFNHGLKLKFNCRLKYVKPILVVGFPSALTNICFQFSQTITAKICIGLTPVIYQTKLYANQVLNFSYSLGYNISKAMGIMIGRLCGMGDFETPKKMARQNLRLVFLINLAISSLIAILASPIMKGLFDASPEMIKWAKIIFFIDIFVEIARAFGHTGEGVLNAVGDTTYMGISSMLSCWIIGVFFAFIAVEYLGLGIIGMWIALAIDEATRAICFLYRWKREKWKRNFEKKTSI